ncbi:unnamed protein product [Leptidea sinapis]|uniref:J domain-containing protein n=1 Tax=Leptidea sinapis TaxID=189913 RepID=A0A5E4R4N2_9NEOP|nr:unnamed protein product [Leptidea sinapis]
MDNLSNIQWNKVAPCLVLLILDVVLEFSECTTQAEVNKHLQLGMDFLVRGQLSDALTHYHAAVEGDPNNYLTYFKRGTVYYALGKAKFALQDFSKVLELKPDFTSARMHRAEVYFKLAEYSKAKEEFLQVTYEDPYNEEAVAYYNQCDSWVSEARLAQAYIRGGDHRAAADTLSRLLEVSPWSAALRQLRADCYIALNDLFSAVSDIRAEVRECLKLDPEHKLCFPLYKKLKKVDKLLLQCEELSEGGQFSRCVESGRQVLKTEDTVTLVVRCLHVARLSSCSGRRVFWRTLLMPTSDWRCWTMRAKDGLAQIVKAYRKAAQKWHPDSYQGDEKKVAEKKFIDIAAAKEKRAQFDSGVDPLDPESGRQPFQQNPFHHFQHGSPFQFKFHFN